MSGDGKNDTQAGNPMDVRAFYAQRRRKNLAIVGTIFGLAVLFFVITIVRMQVNP